MPCMPVSYNVTKIIHVSIVLLFKGSMTYLQNIVGVFKEIK